MAALQSGDPVVYLEHKELWGMQGAVTPGQVVPLGQGEGVIFPVRNRPVVGTRGTYRVNLRHGVSRLRHGRRHTLGIIFHDAA